MAASQPAKILKGPGVSVSAMLQQQLAKKLEENAAFFDGDAEGLAKADAEAKALFATAAIVASPSCGLPVCLFFSLRRFFFLKSFVL